MTGSNMFVNLPTSEALELFAPVLGRLRAGAAEHFGDPDARLTATSYEARPYSHLMRVAVHRQGTDVPASHVFVKIFKPKPEHDGVRTMQLRVAHDFKMTRQIFEAMSQCAGFGVVRPVACYPEHLALITEEAVGETLLAHLQTRARWFPNAGAQTRLAGALEAVGGWLRVFQTIEPGAAQISSTDLRAYVDLRLQRLVGGGIFSPSQRLGILEHLDRIAADIPASELGDVLTHADLAPANILISGSRIVVLDFAMTQRGCRLHDITRLFLQLDLLRAKPQFRASVVQGLQRALLRGFERDLTPERPLFRFLLMLHRVNHLGTLSLRPEPLPGRAFSSHICRLHRGWIRQELEARQRLAWS
jgi:hypothetical protein